MTAEHSRTGESRLPSAANRTGIEGATIANGTRWSLAGLVSKQFLRILFTLLLARLLGPDNFGIVAQATIYMALSAVFLDLGLASALIQRESISRKDEQTATTANVAVAFVIAGSTYFVSPFLADFFDTPELTWVLRVLSISFCLNGVAVVPTAMLTRNLDFRRLTTAETASTVVGGAAGVISVFGDSGYWALVIQIVVRDLTYLAILVAYRGWPVIGWSRSSWSEIAGFGRNVLGAQILSFVKTSGDNTLIGRYLGAGPLALYALSYRVLLLPIQILGQTANRVMFPALSRIRQYPDRVADNFLRVSRSLSLVVMPAMTLVIVTAPIGVPWAFGQEWSGAVEPMRVLAGAGIIRAIAPVVGAMVLAMGRARFAFRWEILSTSVHIAGFAFGLRWGILGVAWGFLLASVPLQLVYTVMVSRMIPFKLLAYFRALTPAATGAAGLLMACWGLDVILLSENTGAVPSLVVLTTGGSLGYLVVIWIFWRAVLVEQLELARQILAGPGS